MSKVSITRSKLDSLADAIGSKSSQGIPLTIDQMRDAVLDMEIGITPSGTKSITKNGTYDVTEYASTEVNVQPKLQAKSIHPSTESQTITSDSNYDGLSSVGVEAMTLDSTTVIPTTGTQVITPEEGHDGLSQVTVNPIPSEYIIPTGELGITENGTIDVTQYASVNVSVPAGGSTYQDENGYIVLDDNGNSVTIDALSVTANGTYTAPAGHAYSPVTVSVSGNEDNGNRGDPIRFFDYDGTLVASYTTVPSTMPDIPTHDKLTNGTWNYTLEQVTEQFNAVGKCDVGANYDTASGKTEIDVTLDSAHLKPFLCFIIKGTVTIDWGDGNTETVTGTSLYNLEFFQHVYAQAGEYTISIDGPIRLYGDRDAPSILRSVGDTSDNRSKSTEYSSSITAIRLGASTTIIDYAFCNCYSLQSVSIPSGVTDIGNYMFNGCHALKSVSIPAGVKTFGDYAFCDCYSLQSVSIPSGVTNIGNNYPFYCCCLLQSVIIPAGVTKIAGSAFYKCSALQSARIPAGVTYISSNAFAYCYGVREYHLEPTTPPTIGSNIFIGIVKGTVIYVPQGCLEAYQTATNWSTYASYMQEEAN